MKDYAYIGDGVYVRYEYGMLALITGTPEDIENQVYLEPEVWASLVKFVEDTTG